MREFKSLYEPRVEDEFDALLQSEEPIVNVEESKRRITISYIFPGFYLVDDNQVINGNEIEFKQVNVEGTGFIAENGKPQLPSFGRYVQIPKGYDYKISVYQGESVEFENIVVKPVQIALTDDPEQEYTFYLDQQTYKSNELYPQEVSDISGPYTIDGYTALLVHIQPIQYKPAEETLVCYSKIDITIDLVEKEVETGTGAEPDHTENMEGFGNLFLNPRRNIEMRLDLQPTLERYYPRFCPTGPELLIIYYDTFKSAASELNIWKQMNGMRTKMVSIDSVPNYTSATTDVSRVAALKKYIRGAKRFRVSSGLFLIPRLKYIILFGDVDMIASETISDDAASGGNWGPVNISDYYYSTSKDPNNNSELVFPWLSTGRIPVRTEQEGLNVVNQIIGYEKNPPNDPDYYQRFTFAALFQDKPKWDSPCDGRASRAYVRTLETIRERMISLGFDVTRVYVMDCPNSEMEYYSDGTTVPQDVKNAVVDSTTATNMLIAETSAGQSIIAHRDHGMKEGWHLPSFTQSDLVNITDDTPSIFFSLNCQTGWFDRPANSESFAETMLKMEAGAPSLIAATRNSSTSHNDEMMKALFDALWSGVLPTFPASTTASYSVRNNRLGDILNYGKSYLPIASNNNTFNKDHFEIYHVIGDPSLEVWKEMPKSIRIKAKYMRIPRQSGSLSIKLSHCPVGGVLTVWYKERLLKRIEPTSTSVTLPLKDFKLPLIPNPLLSVRRLPIEVCFGAPGYRFRKTKVYIG